MDTRALVYMHAHNTRMCNMHVTHTDHTSDVQTRLPTYAHARHMHAQLHAVFTTPRARAIRPSISHASPSIHQSPTSVHASINPHIRPVNMVRRGSRSTSGRVCISTRVLSNVHMVFMCDATHKVDQHMFTQPSCISKNLLRSSRKMDGNLHRCK